MVKTMVITGWIKDNPTKSPAKQVKNFNDLIPFNLKIYKTLNGFP